MLTRDPPDHTRLRSLVSRAFTARRIAELEPRIADIVRDLLEPGLSRGRFDLARDFARPLTVAVIGDLLGVEPERRVDLARWSDDIFRSISGIGGHDRERTKQSYEEFDAYFGAQIEARRGSSFSDLLGGLVGVHDESGVLSTTELLSFCMLLFVAGSETTANLITNVVLALKAHPDVERRLRTDPSHIPAAIEETLRYDSPVQGIFRTTRRSMERFGVELGENEKVCALIASANRDPAAFPDPDRFDIDRKPNAHIAFGRGIHYCLGAQLGRLEARLAIAGLLSKTREIAVDPELPGKRVSMPMVRGMEEYPLVLSPG
jgi:cytochrome P450